MIGGRVRPGIAHLRELAIEPPAGKELRIFGLTDWLSGRFRDAFLRTLEPVWAARRRILLWPFIFFASWGVLVAATTFGVIGAAGASRPNLTTFALVVQAFLGALRLASHYPEADTQTAFGMIAHDAVGLNGAGKTTMVKLLARLHEPSVGAITADGTDISSFRADQWRAKIAVIFQDFVRYEIPAADNIAIIGQHKP